MQLSDDLYMLALPLQRGRDAADVADVGADAVDHRASPMQRR